MPIQPLIDEEAIATRVAELGHEITRDYLGKDVVLVAVLKGSSDRSMISTPASPSRCLPA